MGRFLLLGLGMSVLSVHTMAGDHVEYLSGQDFLARFRQLEGEGQWDTFLKEISNDGKTATVDAAVEKLPKMFRVNYTLVHESQSLQKVTTPLDQADRVNAVRPRVITANTDGSLYFAYNSAHTPTGESLESIVWNNAELKYDFYRILLGHAGNRLDVQKNPAVCKNCHTSQPHPLWGNYVDWDGIVSFDYRHLSASERVRRTALDERYYKRFLATKNQEKRYDFLLPKPDLADTLKRKVILTNFFIGVFSNHFTQLMLANQIHQGNLLHKDVSLNHQCLDLDPQKCWQSGRFNFHDGYKASYNTIDVYLRLLAKPDATQAITRIYDEPVYPEFRGLGIEVDRQFERLDRLILITSATDPNP